jgi:hypothetical protein
MRVSTDPTDPAFIDARPRRVWCNDAEVADWTVADDFRRCVITSDGKVHHGAVRIEQLPAEGVAVGTVSFGSGVSVPINTGFVGVFEAVPEAPKGAGAQAESPAPQPEVAPKAEPSKRKR